MSTLPSWRPVLAATGASIAVAWFLPHDAAIPLAGGFALAVFGWPAFRDRRKSRCGICNGQCRAVLPAEDGEPLSGGETRRWIGITRRLDAGTVAAEPEYRRQP